MMEKWDGIGWSRIDTEQARIAAEKFAKAIREMHIGTIRGILVPHYTDDIHNIEGEVDMSFAETKQKKMPEHVKDCDFNALLRSQVRVMLDYLGMPFNRHPASREKCAELLAEYCKQKPKEGQLIYSVLVHGKAPEDGGGAKFKEVDTKSVKQYIAENIRDYLPEINEEVNDLISKKVEVLDAEVKELWEETQSKIDSTIDHKLKAHRRVEVALPGKKEGVKMKDILPEEFEIILQLAGQRMNTMMIGPAGAGKTFLASKVAEALKMDFASISCSIGMSESQLVGWLIPIGASGQFQHVPASFLDIYEKGGVFLFDELDNSDANTLTFINQAIGNDHFFIPQRHKNPLAKKHKDFVCVAAANTYGHGADSMYVGRNQLDAATLDRFRAGMVRINYSEKVENALIHPAVLQWGLIIRQAIQEHKIRRIMSTRVMINFTTMTENVGWGMDDWNRAYFMDWTQDELELLKPKLQQLKQKQLQSSEQGGSEGKKGKGQQGQGGKGTARMGQGLAKYGDGRDDGEGPGQPQWMDEHPLEEWETPMFRVVRDTTSEYDQGHIMQQVEYATQYVFDNVHGGRHYCVQQLSKMRPYLHNKSYSEFADWVLKKFDRFAEGYARENHRKGGKLPKILVSVPNEQYIGQLEAMGRGSELRIGKDIPSPFDGLLG
jgi:MoxR-like ATPase